MQDLNNLLASGSGTGWNLQYAYGVNNSGHIVGYGTIGGATHAFLLTPVPTPEPSTALLALAGLAGLLAYAWRKRR